MIDFFAANSESGLANCDLLNCSEAKGPEYNQNLYSPERIFYSYNERIFH